MKSMALWNSEGMVHQLFYFRASMKNCLTLTASGLRGAYEQSIQKSNSITNLVLDQPEIVGHELKCEKHRDETIPKSCFVEYRTKDKE